MENSQRLVKSVAAGDGFPGEIGPLKDGPAKATVHLPVHTFFRELLAYPGKMIANVKCLPGLYARE